MFGRMEPVVLLRNPILNATIIATLMVQSVFVTMDFLNFIQVFVLLALLSKLGTAKNALIVKNVG